MAVKIGSYEYTLKKFKINSGRQYVIEIPNIGRNQLAELFYELKFKRGAEIGVDKGKYSEILCKANPGLHLYSIDPWRTSAYEPGTPEAVSKQAYFENCYKEAKKRLTGYNCTIIRKRSMDALKDFKENSLDFVYIDGNHNFVNVTNDIHRWSKKIKVGGIISGHDFAYFPSGKQNHVKYVLLAYTRAYGIRPLFIVGAEAVGQPGIVRDRFRSWFWVKQE